MTLGFKGQVPRMLSLKPIWYWPWLHEATHCCLSSQKPFDWLEELPTDLCYQTSRYRHRKSHAADSERSQPISKSHRRNAANQRLVSARASLLTSAAASELLISFSRSEAPSVASFWSCRLKQLLSASVTTGESPFCDRWISLNSIWGFNERTRLYKGNKEDLNKPEKKVADGSGQTPH